MSNSDSFVSNLRLLNDVLAETPLQEHYFLWGGVLLGWAREGRILSWDDADADFGYFRADRAKLLQAVEPLVNCGFHPRSVWYNNAGEIVRYVFGKDNAVFDFFELVEHGDEDRYWLHVPVPNKRAWIELIGSVPSVGYTKMQFLDRQWRIPADYDAFLSACYGDWHTPISTNQYKYVRDGMRLASHTFWRGAGDPFVFIPPGRRDFSV